ncbi:PEP-CTERM sorting domain-containing protein [Virgifigura deserti]|uniref:PEP-CTERM sorting domain-containing protein n=1 Tax=Virgifigura deserti TaxID=2268457 RepID=UPI003CCC055A
MSFEVFDDGGLFEGENDFPFDGSISIFAYSGNNTENVADYHAASIGTVGSFLTSGLVIGNTLSFDITSIFNDLIDAGATSLGIRLAASPLPDRGAWTFDNFRLTTEDLTTTPVPEPATLALLGVGLAGLGLMRRRRRA